MFPLRRTMALLLLAGAGVTVKSLWRLFQLDQGFERDQVLVFRTPRRGNPGAEEWRRSCERFLSEVERLPGVISAAMAFGTPLNGTNEGASSQIEGQAPPDRLTCRAPEPMPWVRTISGRSQFRSAADATSL